MKIYLSLLCSLLFLFSCEQDTPKLLNEVDGRWKLVKIGFGFPPPNSPTDYTPDYVEIIDFNASKQRFTRTKDGKVVEDTKVNVGMQGVLQTIVFEESKMYSTVSFTENPYRLVLDQSSPVGSVLADGNRFFYEKVK